MITLLGKAILDLLPGLCRRGHLGQHGLQEVGPSLVGPDSSTGSVGRHDRK